MGHLMGTLGKLLDWDNDPFCQIEAKPSSREHNHEGNQEQGQDIRVFDGAFEDLQLLVLFIRARNLKGPFCDALWDKVIHDHHSQNLAVRTFQRDTPADDISLTECLSPCNLQTTQGTVEKFRLGFDRYPCRDLIVEGRNRELTLRGENLHRPQIVLPLLGLNEPL